MTKARLAAAALLLVALAAAVSSLWNDALVIDEVAHITAGYSYLRTGSLRLNPEHPPLVKEIAAWPLLALGLSEDAFLARFRGVAVEEQWRQGRMFLYGSGNDPVAISRAARTTVLLFFYMTSAILLAFWAMRRYGPGPGLLAFVLYAFSPTVLAHARLVTTDVASAAATLAAVLSVLAALRVSTPWRVLVAGSALAVALLVKYSALLLVPFVLMLGLLYGLLETPRAIARRLATATAVVAIGGLLVIAYYQVHLRHWSPRRQYQNTQEMLENTIGDGPAARTILAASEKPLLRAAAQYAAGVMHVVKRTAANNRVYFLGTTRPWGTPLYFPVLYVFKEPLAWWLLVAGLAAGVAAARAVSFDRQTLFGRFEEVALVSWIVLYWVMCLRSRLNVGVRHLLPTYPFAALLLAALAAAVLRRRPRAAWPIGLLAGVYALSTLSIHPSYLAFYNTLAGGPTGGRRLAVDSNLDWGQDLLRLERWLRARGIQRIEVDYFGGGHVAHDLKGIGFDTRAYERPEIFAETEADFLARGDSEGWIAVSVSMLQTALGDTRPTRYRWLVSHPPVAVIGHSIVVWRVTEPAPGR